jgi:hypothetical protein
MGSIPAAGQTPDGSVFLIPEEVTMTYSAAAFYEHHQRDQVASDFLFYRFLDGSGVRTPLL